jgi:hypothetical protein
MAVITYRTDVPPHLRRALMYRRLRTQRWQTLHRHHSELYDAVESSRWTRTSQFFNLLVEVVAVAFFVTGCPVFDGSEKLVTGTKQRLLGCLRNDRQ